MNKFLATVIGIIAAAVLYGFFWIFIPLVSSLLNFPPFFVSIFLCGLIFLVSLLGIRIFKTGYMKAVPIISAVILGTATIETMDERYGTTSYKDGVLIHGSSAYNSFGGEIIRSISGHLNIRTGIDGERVIVEERFYVYYSTYSIYSLNGTCIVSNITKSELDNYLI